MEKKSLKKNYIFNVIYQIVAIITPLITTPYISRVLGNDGVGQSAYVASINTFFLLIANLGFSLYAQREISKYQDDPEKRTIVFWEIFICKAIVSTVAVLGNVLLLSLKVYGDYSFLMMIMTIHLVSTYFDITYIFQGMEKFGTIAMRNIAVRIIGVVAVLLFVKKPGDVWIYVLCQCSITFLAQLSVWPPLFKNIVKVKARQLQPLKHFVPSLRLFIPTVALTIYTILDKFLIGWLVPGTIEKTLNTGEVVTVKLADVENGMYTHAENIVKMLLTIITALGAAVLPRNGFLFKNGKVEEAKSNIQKSFKFSFFIGMPMMFGIAAVAINFSPWFFGSDFGKIPFLLMVLSPLIIIIGFNNVLGQQFLIATGKDTQYTLSIVAAAVINVVLNVLLIPVLFSYGAVIGTVIAELMAFIIQLCFLRKEFSFSSIFKENWKYLLFALIMFGCVFPIASFVLTPSIINTILCALLGMIVYFSLLAISKDNYFLTTSKHLLSKIKNVFVKKQQNQNE